MEKFWLYKEDFKGVFEGTRRAGRRAFEKREQKRDFFEKTYLTSAFFCGMIIRLNTRVLFNGRIPAFQAGCVGSIPITRSNTCP